MSRAMPPVSPAGPGPAGESLRRAPVGQTSRQARQALYTDPWRPAAISGRPM